MYCKVASNLCSSRQEYQYCSKHYQQIRRYGNPITSRRDPRPAIIEGNIAKIPLGLKAKDGYVIVDKEYAYLAESNWRLTHWGYAIRSKDKQFIHRLIMETPKGKVVDHINGDKLDCRVSNMRNCTQAENSRNSKVKSNSSSGIKGVHYWASRNKWVAMIKFNYKSHTIGYFDTPEEAKEAYKAKALELHGEFAGINRG